MNRFIKNNLLLLVVLAASVCAVLALLIFSALQYGQMVDYAEKLHELRSKVIELQKKNAPNPSQKNIPLLEKDIKLFRDRAQQLRKVFDPPLKPALELFVKTLVPSAKVPADFPKTKSLADFRAFFRKGWDAIPQNNIAEQGFFYKQFQRYYPNWGDAMQEFKKQAEKLTEEPITDATIDDVFLAALGIPRMMEGNPEKVSRYMTEYRAKLLGLLGDKKIMVAPAASSFSFSELGSASHSDVQSGRGAPMAQSVPAGAYKLEDIPLIPKQWDIIGDLVKRISRVKIKSLDRFQKRALTGENFGSFVLYNYTFEVVGALDKIRELVSEIDKGYKENRMYVVRSIYLYSLDDPAYFLFHPELITPEEAKDNAELQGGGMPAAPAVAAPRGRRGRGRGAVDTPPAENPDAIAPSAVSVRRKKPKIDPAEEAKKPFFERFGYGDVVAGGKEECRAVINLDYIMLNAK